MGKQLYLVLITGLLAISSAWASDNTVHEYKLNNGLKLFVKEDHRAPVIVTEVWYKIGSSYEPNGLTGVSHALEHMMFKGTPKYPDGKLMRIIAENGGQQNAFTSYDFTAYYEELAKEKLPLSLKLEADRMRNLSLNKSDFDSEIKVVQEERKLRIDNSPRAKTYERFFATAHSAVPYNQPIIGWQTDLESMTVDNARDWYKTWYAPNNANLVVVGDVNPDEVYKLTEKYFGSLKPSILPEVKPHKSLEPVGTRKVEVNVPAELPMLLMGYNVPSIVTAEDKQDAYALEVL
jgi:zinc protease